MKYKNSILFAGGVYLIFILVVIAMANISYGYYSEDAFDEEILLEQNPEQNPQDTILFDNDTLISNTYKLSNKYLAYGSKNNNPYLSIINDKQTKILSEIKYSEIAGSINNIKYNGIYYESFIDSKKDNQIDFFISNNMFIPFHKKQLNINYSKNINIKPIYVVIHETANTNKGANANAHYRYWSKNPSANASAHFVVDSNEIYQMLELNQMAWHVGDNKGYSNIKNTNSIGIEICVNQDGDYMLAREHAINLTINLLNKLNLGIDSLKIHQDASGKYDPIIMLNENLWLDFIDQVRIGLEN